MSRALIIIEGESTELLIFKKVFKLLDFKIVEETRGSNFEKYKLTKDKKVVYLIPGEKTELLAMLRVFDKNSMDLSLHYKIKEEVALNFIVYDGDANVGEEFHNLLNKFNTPEDGMVLISNPCIEVLADNKFYEHIGAPRLYKEKVRQQLIKDKLVRHGERLINYIIENIIKLFIKHIERNEIIFNSSDVMEHVIESYKLLKDNTIDADQSIYEYKYLVTVVYVAVACVLSLTRYKDNTNLIINELKNLIE